MALYRTCGLTIACDRVLPELTPVAQGTAEWTIRSAAPRRTRHTWFRRTYLPDGRQWLSVAYHHERYTLQFSRLAAFEVAPQERVIRCMAAPATRATTVRHLLLDQVLPLIAGSKHRLALHASAVVAPQGAVAFLGEAGRGKSTLAAFLAAAGWPLLSDDCLMIDQQIGAPVALPAYPGVRLFPDTLGALFRRSRRRFTPVAQYTQKRRVGGAVLPFSAAAAALRRIYVVGPALESGGEAVVVGTRTRREGMIELLKYLHCLDVRDTHRAREVFELAGAVVNQVAVRSIQCSWDLSRLDEVRAAIAADVAADV